LTTIELGWNSIGAEGAAALAEALKVNRSVTDFHLNCNSVGAEGAAALNEMWKVNDKLCSFMYG
jgi:hypothetical protein